MRDLAAVLTVACGGAIGSVLRFAIGTWYVGRFGGALPWATFGINVVGAFAIGVVLQYAQLRADVHPYVRLFLAVGVLGGFTTFSTFAYEVVALGRAGATAASLTYAVGSVAVGAVAVLAGLVVGRLLAPGAA